MTTMIRSDIPASGVKAPGDYSQPASLRQSAASFGRMPIFGSGILKASILAAIAFAIATPNANAQDTTETKKTQDLLIPQITLCKSLQKLGSSVEFRGQRGGRGEMLFLKTSFKVGDDAKSLFFLNYSESDFHYLRDYNLTKEEQAEIGGRLSYETTSLHPGRGIQIQPPNQWEEHPDGIGYVRYWRPSDDNSSLIVVATEAEADAFFKSLDDYQWRPYAPLSNLWKKVQLGESDKKEFIQKYKQINKETNAAVLAKLLEWAESL